MNRNHSRTFQVIHPNINVYPLEEINTRIVRNQLDRLLVRCLLCGEINTQRCNYEKHEKICPKKICHMFSC